MKHINTKGLLKLKGKLREKGKSYREMSELLGITQGTFSKKINGERQFYLDEIKMMIKILEITDVMEINFIFLVNKLPKRQL